MANEECIKKCEWMKFENGVFKCKYYERILDTDRDLKNLPYIITIHKCNQCINDKFTESHIETETSMKKLKTTVGWLTDYFYSFKDDFEDSLIDINKILKELDKGINEKE